MSIYKKILKEPLIYFLLLAMLLITVESSLQEESTEETSQVTVTKGDIVRMNQRWEKMYFRSPTPQELEGLISHQIKEEIFYREAKKMGLDENDASIRNRLYQKLSFIAEGLVEQQLPADEQLHDFYQANKDKFLPDTRYSIQLKKIKPSWLKQQNHKEIPSLIESLSNSETKHIFSASMLPERLTDLPVSALEQRLSSSIIPAIMAAPINKWTGPILLQGSHYVLMVEEKIQPDAPEFSKIKPHILNEYIYQKRQQAEETLYNDFRENYDIKVEAP